jgi:hypothetical protein
MKANPCRLTAAILLSLLFQTCPASTAQPDSANVNFDYTTVGFLDGNNFQLILTGAADKKIKGLVAKRENALQNAAAKIESGIISALTDFYINNACRAMNIERNKILNQDEITSELRSRFSGLIKHGEIKHEYYDEDSSAVLVYRISANNLRGEIESIKIKFRLSEEVKK